ncbi:MAG TPA: ABC transporter permease [Terracidiphilus sp.]|nr:ABC transporter permease [Terracidiphilus sp.]
MRWWQLSKRDADLERELDSDLELEREEQREKGFSAEEARYAARRALGNTTLIREQMHEAWGWAGFERLLQDIRYAFRQLRRNPGFAATTVLTLALGIGATTSIFSIVNATLLRPLPYRYPDRLVILWSTMPVFGFSGPGALTDPDYVEWERQNQVFEELAAFRGQTSNLTGSGIPERLLGVTCSASLFPLLGVAPEIGQPFSRENQNPGRENVVLISHQLWSRRFASDRGLLGQVIKLDGKNFTVIGVMPVGFQFPYPADFWIPMVPTADRSNATNQVAARLKPGITLDRATQEITVLQHRLDPAHRHDEIHYTFAFLKDKLVANIRPALIVLLSAVALVLLIACGNAANLFLTRATSRQQEIVMRRALGASRMRIVRQLLTESMLLAGTSGALGLLIAVVTRKVLLDLTPQSTGSPGVLQGVVTSQIDAWVLFFSVLIAVGTGVLFGLVPALSVSKSALHSSARASGNTQTGDTGTRRIRAGLVMGQFALTVVLLIGASLLLKSFVRLLDVKPGLEPRNVAVVNLELPESKYKTDVQMKQFHTAVIDRISALPGVRAAGTVGFGLPFGNGGIEGDFTVEGFAKAPADMASKLVISPDYFRALSIPLIAGRAFDRTDTTNTVPVVIVSRSFAERFWPGQQAIGKRIGHLFRGMEGCTIVGIVGDVKQQGLGSDAPLAIYMPYAQAPKDLTFLTSFMTIVIRTEGSPVSVIRAARAAVQSVDPDIPVFDAASMDDLIAKSVSQPRFNSLLLSTFAALALILASVGIYGVVSYSVTQRQREIGIRMALGAPRPGVTRMVILDGGILALIGISLGVVASFFLSRLISSFLFETAPTDPATFATVSLLLVGVALAACYLPARRASHIDPMTALRSE